MRNSPLCMLHVNVNVKVGSFLKESQDIKSVCLTNNDEGKEDNDDNDDGKGDL